MEAVYGKSNDDWMVFFVVLYVLSLFLLFRVFFLLMNFTMELKMLQFFLSFTFPKSNKSAPELYIPRLGVIM